MEEHLKRHAQALEERITPALPSLPEGTELQVRQVIGESTRLAVVFAQEIQELPAELQPATLHAAEMALRAPLSTLMESILELQARMKREHIWESVLGAFRRLLDLVLPTLQRVAAELLNQFLEQIIREK